MLRRQFTLENWGRPPFNRESFQNVQSLFPTARLSRGPAPARALLEDAVNVTQITYAGLGGETRTVSQMLEETYTDAFLVLKDGVIISEKYQTGMRADSMHLLNSVSKTFVGMLAGIMVDEGIIDPSAQITDYIPAFENSALDGTSVQQALDMTAAVSFGEDYSNVDDDFWIETAVVGWRPALAEKAGTSSLFEFARARKTTEQRNGEAFRYRTLLTNVTAMVIENAARQPVADLVEGRIWRKLGAEQDASVVIDRQGFPYFGAGMSACARDLARFGLLLMNDGLVDDQRIIPAQWIKTTREGNEELRRQFATSSYGALIPGGHYSNQTWAKKEDGLLICIGIHGQSIYVNKQMGIVIVKLSTHPEPADNHLFADSFLAMEALSTAL